MKKSSKSSLKERSLDISLQHENQASYKFSKKNFCTWPQTGLAVKGLIARNKIYYLAEIERRWQDDGAQGLPRGVLGSLRKVTPPDGYLSFERFCAGLQVSLTLSDSIKLNLCHLFTDH